MVLYRRPESSNHTHPPLHHCNTRHAAAVTSLLTPVLCTSHYITPVIGHRNETLPTRGQYQRNKFITFSGPHQTFCSVCCFLSPSLFLYPTETPKPPSQKSQQFAAGSGRASSEKLLLGSEFL